MSFLSDEEYGLLKRLQDDSVWTGLLKKMEDHAAMPRFIPNREYNAQVSNWITVSARLSERESLLSLLSLKADKINLEKANGRRNRG